MVGISRVKSGLSITPGRNKYRHSESPVCIPSNPPLCDPWTRLYGLRLVFDLVQRMLLLGRKEGLEYRVLKHTPALRIAAEPLRDLHDSVLSGYTTRFAKKPITRSIENTPLTCAGSEDSIPSGAVVDGCRRCRTNRSVRPGR